MPVSLPSPFRPLPRLVFASRWLQLPLYLGLILSAIGIAWTDKLMTGTSSRREQTAHP